MLKSENMIFNNFNFRITFYVILIVLTSLVFVWSLNQDYMVATSSGLALLIVIESVSLVLYVKKIKRDLMRFVDAVKNQDTSLVFKRPGKAAFMKELHEGFNEIITDFKLVRKEKELEHHFFQNTIQHLAIGLIAFSEDGKIRLQNKAFSRLLGAEHIFNIQKLDRVHQDLPDLLFALKHGEESLIKVLINNELKHLSLKTSELKLEDENLKIASFQDISREIDRNEIEAWQKLIKVLRHEIMNSISPVRIMSGNLINLVDTNKEKIERDIAEDLSSGLKTIRKRSQGLSNFVESYRSISKIPQPEFSNIRVRELFEEVIALFDKKINEANIKVGIKTDSDELSILGDENLLQQVLINVVKNSIEAINHHNSPEIQFSAYKNNQHTYLEIADNGSGIPKDQMDNIFIPFYSTKEEGSGIGLSFSRQIMHLHNGSIQMHSEEGTGTRVILLF